MCNGTLYTIEKISPGATSRKYGMMMLNNLRLQKILCIFFFLSARLDEVQEELF